MVNIPKITKLMKTKLSDYVVKIKNVLSKKQCNDIVKELEEVEWKQHLFYHNKENKYAPESAEKELDSSSEYIKSYPIIMDSVWKSLHKYIVDDLKFSWFSGWSGFTSIKFNRYQDNKMMANHCDHIHDIFEGEKKGIPILSIVGGLNNNYQGGEFIMFENKKYEIKEGEILIFPSNFLYPHQVKPVTKGTRYSYVSWCY